VRAILLITQLAVASTLVQFAMAVPIVSDDFENVVLSNDWDHPVVNTDLKSGVGALGSSKFARVKPATGILGAKFDGGASEFFVDFYLRIHPGERQFNMMVMTEEVVASEGASLNLRHESDSWWACSGGWQQLQLPGLVEDVWYHFRITCRNWGSEGASYDLELSDPGGSEFTSSVTDLALYEMANPNSMTAGAFSFNARLGNSPGFDLDLVTVESMGQVDEGPLVVTDFWYDRAASTSSLSWQAIRDRRYFVYASSDLVNWQLLGIRIATGSEETFTEEDVSAGFRVYRVQSFPDP